MMRAWSRRGTCQSPHAPLGWCLQITRNEAFRRMACRATTAERELGEVVEPAASEEPDHVIDRLDMRRALAGLRPEERVLIALRYSGDYTQPEIARALNIPEGTAKVRLHRARKRLGTLMERAA
jgi:RNA polymerase sigma-70 factor (ECF subfamily)